VQWVVNESKYSPLNGYLPILTTLHTQITECKAWTFLLSLLFCYSKWIPFLFRWRVQYH